MSKLPRIKNDVPLPERSNTGRRATKWAFLRDMEVGESAHFEYDLEGEEIKKFRARASSSVVKLQAQTDMRFSVRTTRYDPEAGTVDGVGIWRTE